MLNLYFAPIQGYTDVVYRNAHHTVFGGVKAYFTPFVRVEHGDVRSRDFRDTSPENDETGCLVPQIIVKDAEEFSFLVSRLREQGHKHIDVNMGCPFPMQTRKGRGAGLLAHPDNVKKIVAKVNAIEDIAFSVKMRLGDTNVDEWRVLMPIMNDARLTHITMHPRIGVQQYKGEPDMEQFGMFLQECRHDVIYNGDIVSVADIHRIDCDFPNVKGVMIGRGLLKAPWLAQEYAGMILSEDERLARVMKFHNAVKEHYSTTLQGEAHLLMKMKTFWENLEDVIGHKCYKSIKKAVTLAKYNAALPEFSL